TADDVFDLLHHRAVLLPDVAQSYRSYPSRVTRMGFDDLDIVRDEWMCYVPGEIAHIENVLIGEKFTRTHSRLDETEIETLKSSETSSRNELDLQSTDRFELASEASSQTNLAVSLQGQ